MKGYESYRDSKIMWLGSIPVHWELARGKYFFRTRKDINRGNQCSNVLSLTLDGVINNDIDNPIGLSPRDYASYQIFDKDNLVFKLIDLENISTSRVGIVHEQGIMSPAYIRLINRYDCNMRYFYFQYYDLYLRHIYNGLGNGVRSTLNAGDLLNIPIMIPPEDEQDQIARFLDWKITAIDKLISIRREELRNLAELKKALITREVTRGNWERVRLKRVVTVRSEKGTYRDKTDDKYIGLENIRGYSDKLIETDTEYDTSTQSRCREGDLLFGKLRPYLAKVIIAPYDAFCTGELLIISSFDGDMRYLRYVMLSHEFITEVDSSTYGAKMPRANSAFILNISIPVPPISEQKRIATYLDRICTRIDSAITNFTQQIDTLKKLKARLISDTVTGKIDVRNIAVPEKENIS